MAKKGGKKTGRLKSYTRTPLRSYDSNRHISIPEAYKLVEAQRDSLLSVDTLKLAVEKQQLKTYEFDGIQYLDRLDIGRVFYTPAENPGGLNIGRYFSQEGQNPLDSVDYETSYLTIKHIDGTNIFEMDAEFPITWDENSRTIVAQKYFFNPRQKEWQEKIQLKTGNPGERSIRNLTTRVSNFFADEGYKRGYFATEADRDAFRDELLALQINRKLAFNSPVQFNAGIFNEYGIKGNNGINYITNEETGKVERIHDAEYQHPQCHACFICGPNDDLESILKHFVDEGSVFSAGSGIGQNIGRLREARAPLSGGGEASGANSFLMIFDDGAGTIKSGGKSRRAARKTDMNQDHPDIMEFIRGKVREDHKALILMKNGYSSGMDGEAYTTVTNQNTNHSVRVNDEFFKQLNEEGNIKLRRVKNPEEVVEEVSADRMLKEIAFGAWRIGDPGIQYQSEIDRMHTAPNSGQQEATNPCGEYSSLNDTSCDLASLNVPAFMNSRGDFNVKDFKQAAKTASIALDIANSAASYPIEKVAEISPEFRTIGLGYAGVGSALMRKGFAYDSDEGRAWVGAVTSVLTGAAYEMSASLAEKLSPFTHFNFNKKPMLEVMDKHKRALEKILWEHVDESELQEETYKTWDNVIELGEKYGFRNAQASVIAPTGTISFLMGTQDSTGIEPPYSLVLIKNLSGGGSIKIVNGELENALANLNHSKEEIGDIINYITEEVREGVVRGTVIGAPHLDSDNYKIFDTAAGNHAGQGNIPFDGHVKMMAAAQPFVSGGISKTNNFPEHASVKDIYDSFKNGYELGLKGITVFRTNSKPISAMGFGQKGFAEFKRGEKEELPSSGNSFRQEFKIGSTPFLINIGEYADGRPGEIVIESYSAGSTLGETLRLLGISSSDSLKRGLSIEDVVKKWIGHKSEPHGLITIDNPKGPHPYIKTALSPFDFLGRHLLINYLEKTEFATEPKKVKREDLRGFKNGAFRTYERMKIDSWDVDQVLDDPEFGGFKKSEDKSGVLPEDQEKDGMNNMRGVACEKCGNLMRQTAPGCFDCTNCHEKRGGCEM